MCIRDSSCNMCRVQQAVPSTCVALRKRALGTGCIASVDIARVVGTGSTVPVMSSRCWRLGLAGSCALSVQCCCKKNMAALHSAMLRTFHLWCQQYHDQPDKMTDDDIFRDFYSLRVSCRSRSELWRRPSWATSTLPVG